MDAIKSQALEAKAWEWTTPVNGQYPRPWMSDTADPAHAAVFIVGRNPATAIPVEEMPDQGAFIDALFNRHGRSHAKVYARARERLGKGPSPTRGRIARLSELLEQEGVAGVLETNVICYSTPMSADLHAAVHRGGRAAGVRIFKELLNMVRPQVLIAHGQGTRSDLAKILGRPLPDSPRSLADGVREIVTPLLGDEPRERALIILVPSLAPPEWNKWSSWATDHLDSVARRAAAYVAMHRSR